MLSTAIYYTTHTLLINTKGHHVHKALLINWKIKPPSVQTSHMPAIERHLFLSLNSYFSACLINAIGLFYSTSYCTKGLAIV